MVARCFHILGSTIHDTTENVRVEYNLRRAKSNQITVCLTNIEYITGFSQIGISALDECFAQRKDQETPRM